MVDGQIDLVRQEVLPQTIVAVELARSNLSPLGQQNDFSFDARPAAPDEPPDDAAGSGCGFPARLGQPRDAHAARGRILGHREKYALETVFAFGLLDLAPAAHGPHRQSVSG